MFLIHLQLLILLSSTGGVFGGQQLDSAAQRHGWEEKRKEESLKRVRDVFWTHAATTADQMTPGTYTACKEVCTVGSCVFFTPSSNSSFH